MPSNQSSDAQPRSCVTIYYDQLCEVTMGHTAVWHMLLLAFVAVYVAYQNYAKLRCCISTIVATAEHFLI